jgi:PAS domain S-box-containing protein
MALHPGERKRHFPEEAPVAWDPIRRDLEENEDWYRDLVEHSQDLLCVHDLEGRFLSVNPVPARLLGYSVEEVLQTPMREFVDPQFRFEFDAYLREIKRTKEARGRLAVVTRSGEQRILEYQSTLRTERVEKPIVRGIAHDVTERVRAEKALRASNEELLKTAREQEQTLHELRLFRALLDQSNDAIQVMDPETLRFLDVNEKACAELGYSREELLSMTVFDIDRNVDESWRARVRQQLVESGFAIMERVHRRKDGTTFPVEVNLRRVRLDREYSVAVSRDITARKRAEERLREFERVVENLEEMIVVVDREYRYVLANRAYLSYRGITKEQVVGRFVGELVNPKQYETVVKEKLDECFRGKVVNYEIRYRYPQMGERDLSITYLPVEGPTGIDRAACVTRDITERKRAEEALRESEARERARAKELETVLDTVPVAVCIAHDAECRRMTGNRAAHEQMRVPAGQNLSKSAPPEEQPRYRLMQGGVEIPVDLLPMQQAAATGKPVYGRAVTLGFEDGIERETVVNAVPLLNEEGKTRGVVGSSVDVTELKQAEKALRESELLFRTVYERSPVGICLVDSRSGQIVQVNPKCCEIVGRSEEEMLGIDARSITHPDDVGHTSEYLQQLAEEKVASYETEKRYVRPDGSVRWARILAVPMWGKGETRRWHMGLVEDITEQKRAEEAITTLVQVRADSSENFFHSMAGQLAKCLEADYTLIGELIEGEECKVRSIGVCDHGVIAENFTYDLAHTPSEAVMRQGACSYAAGVAEIFPKDLWLKQMNIEGYAGTPLRDSQGRVIGMMAALYTRPLANAKFAEMILQLFSTRTAAEIERKRTEEALRQSVTELREASEALREAKKKLTEEKLYLEQEIDTELGFGDIIGHSKALETVMENVGKVAASNATVLLLGETGTGKELVARAIHWLSQRSGNSFIKLNCAAIPTGLLESELFGNEKGAFTGAVSKKIGRLELADKGTLFLDEIGEIALTLQPKLLRVLQDQEFERLGGTQTLKVDFRLIAATNRDLADAVRRNEFRSDLYYRLNVFPVRVPPLRERREDIPLLVEHFVQKFARRMKKSITSIPKRTMDALMGWEWPGNVRELENFIERSVILTQGSVLVAPLSEMVLIGTTEEKSADETLEAAEREHILRALRESHGQIGGPKGAAMRLGLKRTTLQSKLKRLGINPRPGQPRH